MKSVRLSGRRVFLAATLFILVPSRSVLAETGYIDDLHSQYPDIVGTRLDSCFICHASNLPARNDYGDEWRRAGRSFTAVEGVDADDDGFTSIAEILALTFPGDILDFPPDEDGDFLPDILEVGVPGDGETNIYLPDSDGDGVVDGAEDENGNGQHLDPGETDPRNRDTDSDGYEDGLEEDIQLTDPLDPGSPGGPLVDADSDGLPDDLDPDDASPDADADRFTDVYEAVLNGIPSVTDPATKPPLGDVDVNGVQDNADAQRVLNFYGNVQNIGTFEPGRSDLDRNGIIDNADAQRGLNYFSYVDPFLPPY